MKVVLVNPPRTGLDRSELSPPLGLIRLAAVAEHVGWDAEIVDLNLEWHRTALEGSDFVDHSLGLLQHLNADVYGFTSMAVDSHFALNLARRLKESLGVRCVMGGPHFASIATDLLELCSFVDAVVTGPGEAGFEDFLRNEQLGQTQQRRTYSGLDLPGAPLSGMGRAAYRFVDFAEYLTLNPHRKFDIEGGRGCIFNCAFCYSPGHFGPPQRVSDEALLDELEYLGAAGVEHVFFVEDNFINNPAASLQRCLELAGRPTSLTWSCYATLPQLTPRLLEAMAAAGCTGIFVGIDAVGDTTQRVLNKNFMRSASRAQEILRVASGVGIQPTCALMVAPPSHALGNDFDATVEMAISCQRAGAQVRLNALTYYPSTPLARSTALHLAYDEHKIRLLLDVPDLLFDNVYAKRRPDLFPFHSRYTEVDEWHRFVERVHCLFTLVWARPEALHAAAAGRYAAFADAIVDRTGSVLKLPAFARRPEQLRAFDHVSDSSFQQPASGGKRA